MTLRLFVRQSFTQAQEAEQAQVQEVLNLLSALEPTCPHILVTGAQAHSSTTFRTHFEKQTGKVFSPKAFRDERLQLLQSAHAMIVVRTGLSESSAFEIAYNIYSGLRLPMFFAVSKSTPIRTTLLQDLEDLCNVQYHVFTRAEELAEPLQAFLKNIIVAES